LERATLREITYELDGRGAARGRRSRTSLLLELTASGAIGRGEAAPLPGMSPDSLDDARAVLEAFAARVPLEGSSPAHALAIAEHAACNGPRSSPSARFALETALLELFATSSDRTEDRVSGDSWVVDDPDAAREAVAHGARSLKIKVGGSKPGAD